MAAQSKSQRIAGFPVERLAVGRHELGQIAISDDVTVVFRMADDGGGGGSGSSSNCLACRIGAISRCADLVCPDIKANDPNASCSDAILECTELACRGSCKDAAFGGGGILVFA